MEIESKSKIFDILSGRRKPQTDLIKRKGSNVTVMKMMSPALMAGLFV